MRPIRPARKVTWGDAARRHRKRHQHSAMWRTFWGVIDISIGRLDRIPMRQPRKGK